MAENSKPPKKPETDVAIPRIPWVDDSSLSEMKASFDAVIEHSEELADAGVAAISEKLISYGIKPSPGSRVALAHLMLKLAVIWSYDAVQDLPEWFAEIGRESLEFIKNDFPPRGAVESLRPGKKKGR